MTGGSTLSCRPHALDRWLRGPLSTVLLVLAGWLVALTNSHAQSEPTDTPGRLVALAAADVLLLGEQHDAPSHQQIAREVVQGLAERQQLAALVLEMLPAGRSSAGLKPDSVDDQVRQALAWNDRAWPWQAYGPIVMAAVRAGVPVLGGNLAMDALRASMGRSELDQRLPAPALARQQALIREGHCGLLPDSQVAPMTRMQIARDLSLAATLQEAARGARPKQQVLLISGSVHADKALGVPQHLPSQLKVLSVRLLAQGVDPGSGSFDAHWPTAAAPAKDYCAGLREQFKSRGSAQTPPATARP
jgi:uncharacterized iron-regulated protein